MRRAPVVAAVVALLSAVAVYLLLRAPPEPSPSPTAMPTSTGRPPPPPRPALPEPLVEPQLVVDVAPAGFPPNSRVVIDARTPSTFQVDGGAFELPLDGVRLVRGEADGYVPWELDLAYVSAMVAASPTPRPRVTWFVAPHKGRVVSGKVVSRGAPVADATVRCVQRGMNGIVDGSARSWSNAEGHFTIACGEGQSKLVASHPRFRRTVSEWLELEKLERDGVELELVSGFVVSGTVLTGSGEPARGVEVTVRSAPEKMVQLHGWDEERVTFPPRQLTDADGRFQFEPLTGAVGLTARSRDGSSVRKELTLTGDADVELTLESGNHVAGLVTLDGQPLASALVRWACGRGIQQSQLTDERGHFALNQLTPRTEPCFVEVRPPGEDPYSVAGAQGGFLGGRASAAFGDEHVQLELKTEKAGEVELEFRGAEEKYSGEFALEPTEPATNTPQRATNYSPAPGAEFKPMRPGRYRLTATLNDGLPPEPQEVVVVAGETTHVLVRIPDGAKRGEATGQFIDAVTLKPMAGVQFCYSNSTAPGAMCTAADADGRFRFTFSAAKIGVSTNAPGHRSKSVERKVGSGESGDFGQIPLEPTP